MSKEYEVKVKNNITSALDTFLRILVLSVLLGSFLSDNVIKRCGKWNFSCTLGYFIEQTITEFKRGYYGKNSKVLEL